MMARRSGLAILGILPAIAGWLASPLAAAQADPPAPKYQRAVLIRFEGTITPLLEQFLYRKLDDAEQDGADLVIVEIDSPGGLVESSFNIAHRLRDLDWAATVAYVPREALSGAAIVALGCEQIIMDPDAVLGDAGPIVLGEDFLFRHAPEKVRSDLARKIRDLAEGRNRPPALAEAMVDMNLVVYEVTDRQTGAKQFMSEHELKSSPNPDQWEKGPPVLESREGSFLEVNGRRAVELTLAEGNVNSRQQLQQQLGLTEPPRVIKPSGVDTAVYILNWPWITGLLFVVGLVALYVEVSTPGLGLGGLVSLLCFALFFWSRFLGGTAEVLEIVLFLTGLAFLAVEIFVLPGFGVAGITGLLLMLAGVLMASQTFLIPETKREWEVFGTSVLVLSCSAVVFVSAAAFLSRHFGSLPIFNRLILQPAAPDAMPHAATSTDPNKPLPVLAPDNPYGVDVGDWGLALSPLRPSGKARFGDRYLDVLTDGDFVERGRQVRIIEIQGSRIVVRDVEEV
jgi:membrane-bound serine protease (ClpP class)